MKEIIDSVLGYIPPQYQKLILLILALGPHAVTWSGRAFHALANGGGLVGVYRAIMFGTNTPKSSPPENGASPGK